MIKQIFSGGILNLITFLFTFITSFLIVRILDPNQIVDYYKLIALLSWGSLTLIAVNNHGIILLSSENDRFNKIYIFIVQLIYSLIYVVLIKIIFPTVPIVLFAFAVLNFISLEWVFIAKNKPNILIIGSIVNKAFVAVVLVLIYTYSINISTVNLIQILAVGMALNLIILLRKIKFDAFDIKYTELKAMMIIILKAAPFYLLHGQIFNYVLMFNPFDDNDAGLVIYSRIALISVGFITSLSHFTMPLFNNSLNNWNKFWKGLMITFCTSAIIVVILMLLYEPVEYVFLGENRMLSSHRLVFAVIIIVYPIYNYFVVNHYIVKRETNRLLLPLVIVNFPLFLFQYFNLGPIAPYIWVAVSFLSFSSLFVLQRKSLFIEFMKTLRLSYHNR